MNYSYDSWFPLLKKQHIWIKKDSSFPLLLVLGHPQELVFETRQVRSADKSESFQRKVKRMRAKLGKLSWRKSFPETAKLWSSGLRILFSCFKYCEREMRQSGLLVPNEAEVNWWGFQGAPFGLSMEKLFLAIGSFLWCGVISCGFFFFFGLFVCCLSVCVLTQS